MELHALLEDSFRKDYKKWYFAVRYKAKTHEVAEEVIQEACYRALKYAPTYNSEKPFDDWFFTILNNALMDKMREERHSGMSVQYKEEFETGYVPDGWSYDVMRKIRQDINKLPSPRKDICKLYFCAGYTPREITQIVDSTNNAVRSIIKRYRKTIEENYAEEMRC